MHLCGLQRGAQTEHTRGIARAKHSDRERRLRGEAELGARNPAVRRFFAGGGLRAARGASVPYAARPCSEQNWRCDETVQFLRYGCMAAMVEAALKACERAWRSRAHAKHDFQFSTRGLEDTQNTEDVR